MSEQKNKIDIKKYLDLLVRGLKHLFLHNAILKVIAIIISIVLWAGLISQDENVPFSSGGIRRMLSGFCIRDGFPNAFSIHASFSRKGATSRTKYTTS